jgi:hypothetical protein
MKTMPISSQVDREALPSREDLVAGPINGYSVALLLVARATTIANGPVGKEVIEWYADYAEHFGDHLHLSDVLSSTLGPSPRREALYLALGELVGAGYLNQGTAGFDLTKRGQELSESLAAAPFAPFFATSPPLTRLDTVPAF